MFRRLMCWKFGHKIVERAIPTDDCRTLHMKWNCERCGKSGGYYEYVPVRPLKLKEQDDD